MSYLRRIFFEKGFLICLALSLIILFVFFGKLIVAPNTIFFGTSIDAIQVYFNSFYHAKYDKDFLNSLSMFYPYAESSFFTGCMPMLTTLIKHVGLENYTIGIINLSMLFSFLFSALFLYLIFKEYGVQYLFACFAAVFIAFLSPQIARLYGHFALSFACVIPFTIWLILKFKNNSTYMKSFLIAVNLFFWASMHLYLYIFLVALISSYWVFVVINFRNEKLKLSSIVVHYFIQIILPFIVLQLLILLVDARGVRTNSPWGFFVYFSNFSGVFYSANPAYSVLYKMLNINPDVSYEGIAFIGMASVVFCFFIVLRLVLRLLQLRFIFAINIMNDGFLSALFYCSFICLLFSFCIPFKYGFEWLLDYIGFLKQFRALGRFTWIFYYVINICLIIYISNILKDSKNVKTSILRTIVMFLTLGFLGFDAYHNIKSVEHDLNNPNNQWVSGNENTEVLNWIRMINSNDYQAILSLPNFQTGSENFNSKVVSDKVVKSSCLVSIKTGLPLISVLGSRLILDKAYENLRLTSEPTGKIPQIFDDFHNQRDILIVAVNKECSECEKGIISLARLIYNSDEYSIYRITLSQLKQFYSNYASDKIKYAKSTCIYKIGDYYTNDTVKGFVAHNFNDQSKVEGCFDKGFLSVKSSEYTTIINSEIPNNQDSAVTLSFWVKNMQKDLVGRTYLEISAVEKNGSTYSILYSNFLFNYSQLDDNWALIEYSFVLKNKTDVVKATIWNPELKTDIVVDNVLLKPTNTSIYYDAKNSILFNNKIYYK